MLRGAYDFQSPIGGSRGLLTCRSQLLKWDGFLECAVSACGTGNVPVLHVLAVTSLARQAAQRCANHEDGWEDAALRFKHAPRAHSYPHDRTDAVRSMRCSRLQHMVVHRVCRDITAEILHSALSMRSRLRTAPGGQTLNGGSRPCK